MTAPLPAETAAEILAALRSGNAIVCMAKCVSCQFGQCPDGPHTWMDVEDIEYSTDTDMPTTPDEWAELARTRPCGCHCRPGPSPTR